VPAVWRVAPEGGGGMRGLILHDDEVRALRDAGEVTVVRPMKPQPPEGHWWAETPVEMALAAQFYPGENGRKGCPLGTPGERRWVKECWTGYEVYMSRAHSEPYGKPRILYRADGELEARFGPYSDLTCLRWRSAVHMPQWASRLTAECASVTVQQREGVWEWHAVYRRVAA